MLPILDSARMLEKIHAQEILLEEDLCNLNALFSQATDQELTSLIDVIGFHNLTFKLLSSGICQTHPLIDKINQLAHVLHTETLLPSNAAQLLKQLFAETSLLQKVGSLGQGDRLVLYYNRFTGNKSLELQGEVLSLAKTYASAALYSKTESLAEIMPIFLTSNQNIFQLVDRIIAELLTGNSTLEELEIGGSALNELHSMLSNAIEGLIKLKQYTGYQNMNSILLIERAIDQISSYKKVLSCSIVELEEALSYLLLKAHEADMQTLSASFSEMKAEASKLEGYSLNAAKMRQEEKFLKVFAKDLACQALEKSFTIPTLQEADPLPLLKINGEQRIDIQSAVKELVGDSCANTIMHILSKCMLEVFLTDLSCAYQSVACLHHFAELTVDQYNQVEIVFKAACGIGSAEVSAFFLAKRTFQIPLKQLHAISQDGNTPKFDAIDLVSPVVQVKDLDFAGGYERCLPPLLAHFNQKNWGKLTGCLLAKTASSPPQELAIDGSEAFRKILRGEEVELQPRLIKGQMGSTYSIPSGFAKDLERFAVLRLNGTVIFSNVSPQLSDPCKAFEKIAEAFAEEPTQAVLARLVPIALTQTGIADLVSKCSLHKMVALGCPLASNFEERILDIQLTADGMLTMTNKAIQYTFDPEYPTHALDGIVLYRKFQMPFSELKQAVESQDDTKLVHLSVEDKLSQSFLFRRPEQTLEDAPLIFNSSIYASKIDEKAAYNLLEHFN